MNAEHLPLPTDCWYAVAASDTVERSLVPLRAVDRPVVLFRTTAGQVVALEDRCAHRAYPLSAGRLVDDRICCGLCGFEYDADGQCVRVPTQSRVPFGARVQSYPVHERDGLVWAWFGEPGRARLHRVPELPWLVDGDWSCVGAERDVEAGFLLLHENFADVTQVPFIAPEISPTVLAQEPPPLQVIVSETSVALEREFPPAPLPPWQAELLGVEPRRVYRTSQKGMLPTPAVWIDHWDAQDDNGQAARLRFLQLVTPIDGRRSRLMWRVCRDFAVDQVAADEVCARLFGEYYERSLAAIELAQRVIDVDGPGPEVNVSADAVGLKVREIVQALLVEEGRA